MPVKFDHPRYDAAVALAKAYHAGQVDKTGHPKFDHVTRVSQILVNLWPDATLDEVVAALLHDTIEDTAATHATLLGAGVSARSVQIVERLSHAADIPYLRYIDGICRSGDIGAMRVKMADILDNLDPRRQAYPGRDVREANFYRPALGSLLFALGMRWFP